MTIHGMTLVRNINAESIAKALFTLFFCVQCYVKSSTRDIMAQAMGHASNKRILVYFCNGWLHCRDAFDVVLCLYCYLTGRVLSILAYGLSTKVLQKIWYICELINHKLLFSKKVNKKFEKKFPTDCKITSFSLYFYSYIDVLYILNFW